MVWGWGLGTIGGLLALVAQFFLIMGYELSYDCIYDDTVDAT